MESVISLLYLWGYFNELLTFSYAVFFLFCINVAYYLGVTYQNVHTYRNSDSILKKCNVNTHQVITYYRLQYLLNINDVEKMCALLMLTANCYNNCCLHLSSSHLPEQ